MLDITLNKDRQFGHDGPHSGAKGSIVQIVKQPDGEHWALCYFFGFESNYWMPLDYVLHPVTDFSETYWSTDV